MNKNYKEKSSLHTRVLKGGVQIQDRFGQTRVCPHIVHECQASKNPLSIILLDLSV